MATWVAAYKPEDEFWVDEIQIGYEGALAGFEAVLEDGSSADLIEEYTVEDIIASIGDFFGQYDSFRWLPGFGSADERPDSTRAP